jgi:hypothetical protein
MEMAPNGLGKSERQLPWTARDDSEAGSIRRSGDTIRAFLSIERRRQNDQ